MGQRCEVMMSFWELTPLDSLMVLAMTWLREADELRRSNCTAERLASRPDDPSPQAITPPPRGCVGVDAARRVRLGCPHHAQSAVGDSTVVGRQPGGVLHTGAVAGRQLR